MVVLEAFAASKPILAFDVPSLNEHIESWKNGILIPPFKVDEMAQACEKLILDESLRTKIGKEGFQTWRSRYSLNKMLDNTETFYRNVLKENKKRK